MLLCNFLRLIADVIFRGWDRESRHYRSFRGVPYWKDLTLAHTVCHCLVT